MFYYKYSTDKMFINLLTSSTLSVALDVLQLGTQSWKPFGIWEWHVFWQLDIAWSVNKLWLKYYYVSPHCRADNHEEENPKVV